MAEQEKAEAPGTENMGLAFKPKGDLPGGVPVGDQTPETDYGENVTEKGGGPTGVKVPEESD